MMAKLTNRCFDTRTGAQVVLRQEKDFSHSAVLTATVRDIWSNLTNSGDVSFKGNNSERASLILCFQGFSWLQCSTFHG